MSTWISFNTPTSKVTVGAFRTMIQTVIHVGIVSLHNNISLCTHLHHTQHVFGRAADYSLHVLGTKQYLGFVLSILASHNLKSKHDDLHSSSQDLHAKWLLSTAHYYVFVGRVKGGCSLQPTLHSCHSAKGGCSLQPTLHSCHSGTC